MSVLLIFVLFMVNPPIRWSRQIRFNPQRLMVPSVHLVTGLLVNPSYAWNQNRQGEAGLWLLNPLLDSINKTVYNSDIFLTDDELNLSSALDRFAKQRWQEYILKSLSNRTDIDLRPIAQYKRSQECPYYLTYILDHYHDLPEIILFSHGRPEAHNPNILEHWSWFIEQVQQDTKRHFFNASIGFLSANCGIYVARYTKGRPILDLLGYNRTINPLANQAKTLFLRTYCCAQFIVHRSRILLHPLSFWRLALKIVIDTKDCSHFEHLWYILFGEPDEFDQRKTLAKWYEDAHPQTKEKCPTSVVN